MALPRFASVLSDGLHVLLLALFSGHLFLFTGQDRLKDAWAYMALARLVLGARLGRPILTAVLNAGFLVCELAVYYKSEIPDDRRAVAFFVIVCGMSYITETSMHAEVHSAMQASMSAESEARVHDVLSHLCDAVVELDGELNIIGGCPQFSAMVLRGGSCTGHAFCDYVHSADQRQCRELFASDRRHVASMRVRLLAAGTVVRAYMWHTSSCDLVGRKRHIVGFQESVIEAQPVPDLQRRKGRHGRHRHRADRASARAEEGANAAPATAGDDHEVAGSAPDMGAGVGLEVSDEETSLPEAPARGPERALESGELAARVDTLTPGLRILELTTGLRMFLGSRVEVGSKLLPLMCSDSGFGEWVQIVMNMHLVGTPRDEIERCNLHEARARLPGPKMSARVRCSLVFLKPAPPGEEEDDDGQNYTVYIVLRAQEQRRAERQTGTPASPSSSNTGSVGGPQVIGRSSL